MSTQSLTNRAPSPSAHNASGIDTPEAGWQLQLHQTAVFPRPAQTEGRQSDAEAGSADERISPRVEAPEGSRDGAFPSLTLPVRPQKAASAGGAQ